MKNTHQTSPNKIWTNTKLDQDWVFKWNKCNVLILKSCSGGSQSFGEVVLLLGGRAQLKIRDRKPMALLGVLISVKDWFSSKAISYMKHAKKNVRIYKLAFFDSVPILGFLLGGFQVQWNEPCETPKTLHCAVLGAWNSPFHVTRPVRLDSMLAGTRNWSASTCPCNKRLGWYSDISTKPMVMPVGN